MKNKVQLSKLDLLIICVTSVFFLSCIATTLRTAETLEPGEVSLTPGYMQVRSIEEFEEEPVQLLGTAARFGVIKQFDIGVEHVLDISKENDNQFGSVWADINVQLTNNDKSLMKPILSTGLMKGYVYHSDAKIHITTLPVLLSLKVNEKFTPTLQ